MMVTMMVAMMVTMLVTISCCFGPGYNIHNG